MKRLLGAIIIVFYAVSAYSEVYVEDITINDIVYSLYAFPKNAKVSSCSKSFSGDITIPSTIKINYAIYPVTSIERLAFNGCKGLTSIKIPNSVTSIGEGGFYYCAGLTSITLGDSVESIGKMAFSGCSSLTSIEIPNSVTSIGSHAFSYCEALTSIVVENANRVYDSRENCNAIIETATNTLIQGCKNTIIPNSVTSIGEGGFYYCAGLTSIEIPNSVRSIGYYAFEYCIGLTSIEIPNSVTSIGDYAFSECTSINLVVVDWKVPLSIDSSVFRGVALAKSSLTVPYGTKSLYSSATGWKEFGKIIEKAPIPVTSISLNKTSSELYLGESITLTASISPSNATNKSVQWTSLDETVATVEDGVVRTKNIGKTIISAKTTDGTNLTATCNISVNPILVSSLSLDNSSLDLKVGESVTLSAIIKPDNATNKTIEWSSSDNSVVSVSNGVVSALSAGTCIVKVKTTDGSNRTATCNVTVKKHPQTIEWNQDLSSIICGGELVELHAESSSGLPVIFLSSDENVASIFDMGNVVYLNPTNPGMAKITATQVGDNYYEAVSVWKDVNVVEPSGIEDIMPNSDKYVIHTIGGICIGNFSKEEYQKFLHNGNKGLFIVNGIKTLIK